MPRSTMAVAALVFMLGACSALPSHHADAPAPALAPMPDRTAPTPSPAAEGEGVELGLAASVCTVADAGYQTLTVPGQPCPGGPGLQPPGPIGVPSLP
jgi:hypothetical protein